VLLKDFRFSQRCCLKIQFFRRCDCVSGWIFVAVPKGRSAFIFRDLDCLTLKFKALTSFKTSGKMTQRRSVTFQNNRTALKRTELYLQWSSKPTNAQWQNTLYHVSICTDRFRSLLRPSSGCLARILIEQNSCPNGTSKTTPFYNEYHNPSLCS
jgi:hypothetical protein